FQPALKGPLQLAGADPLFAAGEQVKRLEPYPHRHMALLKNRADLDVEGLAAGVAFVKADPGSLALQPADLSRVHIAAMRAFRTVRPQPRLDKGVGRFFAVKVSVGKDGLHGRSPIPANHIPSRWVSQVKHCHLR